MRVITLAVVGVATLLTAPVVFGASLFSSTTELDLGRKFILPDPAGDTVLIVPPICETRRCPLIIVNHGRDASPAGELHQPTLERFFQRLGGYGYALLFSEDAGPESWGNDAALAAVRRVFDQAKIRFDWSDRVYTLGISMGGLSATLTAYCRTLDTPVAAVALIAGRVNLADAHAGPPARTAAIDGAYRSGGAEFTAASRGYDPVNGFAGFVGKSTPVVAVVSPNDNVVVSAVNGERLVMLSRAAGAPSITVAATGPHVGRGYFTPVIADQIAGFFARQRYAADQRSQSYSGANRPNLSTR